MIVLNKVTIVYRDIHSRSINNPYSLRMGEIGIPKQVIFAPNRVIMIGSAQVTPEELYIAVPDLKKFVDTGFEGKEILYLVPEVAIHLDCKRR